MFSCSTARFANIAYGRPDAPEEAIIAAAKAGQAHAFITTLPRGYNTIIGDQGVRLSGGQRQRVALARALLVDPPILVLDEATAMFDDNAETAFIAECSPALSDKTVLLITHRPRRWRSHRGKSCRLATRRSENNQSYGPSYQLLKVHVVGRRDRHCSRQTAQRLIPLNPRVATMSCPAPSRPPNERGSASAESA